MSNLEAAAHAIGKDGFNWWIGQVENDGSDPDYDGSTDKDYDFSNKVKARIVGYHNPDKVVLPTKDLPWSACLFPVMYAQKSGIGTNQQLQVGSWVVGFFMDGSSAQLPVIMGSIPDENPEGSYEKEGDPNVGFQNLLGKDYVKRKHGDGGGSQVGGTADTVDTGTPEQPAEGEESTTNPRGKGSKEPDLAKQLDKDTQYTVDVGNGKCGTNPEVTLKGALGEFLKFARGVERNDIGDFVNKYTGKIEDVAGTIEAYQDRIQGFMGGAMASIKGTVLYEVNKHIQKTINDIKVPNPDLLIPARNQIKNISDLINCLFKQIFDELLDVIGGMLKDLFEQALDAALCLVQDVLADLFGGLMDKILSGIKAALGILEGALGAIMGAAQMIQGISSKILDLIDMVCKGELSCALGLSTFETGAGGRESEGDKSKKQQSMYSAAAQSELKGGKTLVVGDGKPNSRGYVPVTTMVDGKMTKRAFNTKTGEYALVGAAGTGVSDSTFEKGKSILEKFDQVYPIRASDGTINIHSLNCSPENIRKAPCFPELVWDNAQSTSIIKALPIIDDIGSMVGVFMRGKGSDINTTAKVRAMFTCNEPEGKGALLEPVVSAGKIEKVKVLKKGLGYGLDPDNTYCPKEQVVYLIPNIELQDYTDEGDLLFFQPGFDVDENTAMMQVVDFNYNNSGYIGISTLDKNDIIPEGVGLQTAGGTYKFVLNPVQKFLDLAIPQNAVALWANCSDLLPVLDTVEVVNVGKDYKEPKIKVGKDVIGTIPVDKKGRLLKPSIDVKTVGFVTLVIEDPTGDGAQIVPTYNYVGPSKFNEIYSLETYIDCVGHPEL